MLNGYCAFKKVTGPLKVEDYSQNPIYVNLVCGFLTPETIVNNAEFKNVEFVPKFNYGQKV